MLYSPVIPPNTTVTSTPSPVRDINGRKLSGAIANISPVQRTFQTGALCLHHLTRRQALALTGASTGYLSTVVRLTPEEREQVRRGKLALAVFHKCRREMSAVELDRLVAQLGAERVMAALDRFTRPQFKFAAE